MVLVHGDDKGLVLPPRVADIQAIVVPCGITASSSADERAKLMDSCKDLVKDLIAAGLRAEGDYRDNYSPGWKFNHWELKVCSFFFYNLLVSWEKRSIYGSYVVFCSFCQSSEKLA